MAQSAPGGSNGYARARTSHVHGGYRLAIAARPAGRCRVILVDSMRSYKDILSFLIIREQLSLGWKILFFIVCAALVYGSISLSDIRFRSTDFQGTVVRDRPDLKEGAAVTYLTVRLDNGDTVHANAPKETEYRPGRRVLVRRTTTNFFGFKTDEFKAYLQQRDQ